MSVRDEAYRIWTTIPRNEWPQAVASLPEWVERHGVRWLYQESVRQTLMLALSASRIGMVIAGCHAENRCCAGAGSCEEPSSSDER